VKVPARVYLIESLPQKIKRAAPKISIAKACAVVRREFRVLQEDGTAKLREDDFEVQN